ncbi:MAG: carboxymethylenebutenolidase [Gammaproteobacteria bacterium]|uniref:dienelactone hydrolase family protein n=1 Tax=Pseudomaricurvus alcaniphilus TaxID=1166482 RepID=UPI00140BB16D|nr:dienelactone hydrolase family protein [Pseudomaricurvus alcaniphilus]MBR9909150.1 carboxymethylenebutenolidase [Gammaproteobacteria bacterium]NHN39939.1 carboxymethylenebutenolidase [Pseudomaricurvus alcaniphilus]
MTIKTQTVQYSHAGVNFEGFMAWDDALAGPLPAVAVAHTWAGRGQLECDKAVQLARLGYVGFALDAYGDGRVGSGPEENAALMNPLLENRALLQERLGSGIAALQAQPQVEAGKVAAVGFCFGGLAVLDLARVGAEVLGVISFHGLLKAPDNTAGNSIAAKVLVLHGYDDPMVPPQDVLDLATEMTSAGADWQLHAYGRTVHAFTNPAANNTAMGTVYNPTADRRSWQAARNFLAELFG